MPFTGETGVHQNKTTHTQFTCHLHSLFSFFSWFLFCFLLLHVCFWSHRQEKEIELVKLTTAGNGLVQQPVDAPETVPFSVVHTYTHTHKQETDTQSLSFKLGMCDNSTKNTSCDFKKRNVYIFLVNSF